MKRARLCLALMLVASCGTDESLFELVIPIPARAEIPGVGTISHMAVQLRFGSDVMFDRPWSVPSQEVLVLSEAPTSARFFVFGPSNSAEPLNVRVLYCADDGCGVVTGAARLEHHSRFARILYEVDEPTSYTLSEATLDTASTNPTVIEIDRCAVSGCGASQSLACDLNGVHRCE